MNRLFRGFHKLENKFIYGYYRYDGNHHAVFDFERYGNVIYRIDKKSLGQDIGIEDKNGNKIYDGDIVKTTYEVDGKISNDIFEIKYEGVMYVGKNKFHNLNLWAIKPKDIEIIGNTYKNPELLQ